MLLAVLTLPIPLYIVRGCSMSSMKIELWRSAYLSVTMLLVVRDFANAGFRLAVVFHAQQDLVSFRDS